MSNKQETVADITAEMRNEARAGDSSCLEWVASKLRSYADRIEAAAKREREAGAEAAQVCGEIGEMIGMEATREESSRVGNSAKMREAVRGLLEIVCIDCKSSYEIDGKCVKCPRVVAAEAALSAPPRNCDVLSKSEVLEILKDRSFSKEDTIEWLYDEAKGEIK